MTSPQSTRLLQKVIRRIRVASIARMTYWMLLVTGAIYATLLLVSRLTAVIPDRFTLPTVLAVPGAALLLAILFHRRPTSVEAARRVDQACGTKDLFLTVAMLENSPGEFKPLVNQAAEDRASLIHAVDVVPMQFERRFLYVAGMLAVLLAGVFFLPRLDPFGKIEAAETLDKQQQELQKSKKATSLRIAEVQKSQTEATETKEVKKVVEKLKSDFRKMKPDNQKANSDALAENQKVMGEKYRKLSSDRLREFLADKPMAQDFGGANRDKLEKWTRELQQGSTESLNKELSDLKDELEKLSKETDPIKKAEMQQKARKRMQELADFAGKKANSNELGAAIKRALEQLEMAKKEGMASEATESAKKSLELAKMELQQLAQSVEDLKDLEKSLQAIQKAKQANAKEALDGKQAEGAQTMEEYAALYESLMKGQGGFQEGESEMEGEGMGGPGRGRGGKAPEDDTVKTDFKDEQSKSAIKAGKILLTLKTQGMGEKGDAKTQYRDAVQNIRQGLSEAILTEQIPPGYHEGIKKYFDSIEDKSGDAEKAEPAPAPAEKTDAGK